MSDAILNGSGTPGDSGNSDGGLTPDENQERTHTERKWQPLGPIERRVLGVLIEKAKTTPDYYPMTLNAICTACNQKSNRKPVMQLDHLQVEEALEKLRQLGAVSVVLGSGRADKYRHLAYEWLGIDKVEAAVIAELLLRGPQTEGELRAHVQRMEQVADLASLRAILLRLKEKGLVTSLTPEGRGHVVTHTLYLPQEMEKLRAEYAGQVRPTSAVAVDIEPETATHLAEQIRQIHHELKDLYDELRKLADAVQENSQQIRDLRNELGV